MTNYKAGSEAIRVVYFIETRRATTTSLAGDVI
jgi:hypothetical protein